MAANFKFVKFDDVFIFFYVYPFDIFIKPQNVVDVGFI